MPYSYTDSLLTGQSQRSTGLNQLFMYMGINEAHLDKKTFWNSIKTLLKTSPVRTAEKKSQNSSQRYHNTSIPVFFTNISCHSRLVLHRIECTHQIKKRNSVFLYILLFTQIFYQLFITNGFGSKCLNLCSLCLISARTTLDKF